MKRKKRMTRAEKIASGMAVEKMKAGMRRVCEGSEKSANAEKMERKEDGKD